jgi:leader peptidase (prepilin peptidase) / N-methyltransferase
MLYVVYFLLYFLIFLFGSCIGSFLNVIIYRVPRGIPFWKGRSFCPICNVTLKPYDMIPVLSYFFLRGRCRNCNSKISQRYPLVETITGLIALLIYWETDFSLIYLEYFVFASVLVAIAFIDYDTMTIPNGLLLVLAFPAIAALFLNGQPDLLSRIVGFFAVSLPMFLLTLAIPECFGGGDIKLIASCGFMLGWQNTLLAIFIALLFGGAHGIYLIIKDKNNRKKHFAFGQYICIGVFAAMLYGDLIINGYLQIFNLN